VNEHSTYPSAGPAVAEFMALVDQRKARIGILGLGYVGIPLALRFHEVGYPVLGFDIDDQRIEELNAGESPIKHIPSKDIAAMAAGGFQATSDFSRIAEVEAIIICVPTPLSRHREPDLSYIVETMKAVTPHIRAGQMLSLESTTWPGTTEEVLRPFIDSRGFTIGEDFFLVYSPEREDPGNPNFSTHSIPKVVGGSTPACRQVGERLYGAAVDKIVPVSSTQAAELTKLLENIHRAVNIGLVNEMKIIADKMDIDIFEVIDAAKTKPFGFTAYYPGPGLGGHCIPIDPFYLTWKAKEYGLSTHFIELAGEVNREMPAWVVAKTSEALNVREKSIKSSRILALGIAYKKDVDDTRESPSVLVMEMLRDKGAIVEYSDPFAPTFPKMREHKFELSSVNLTPENIASFDAIVLLTDHSNFDYDEILFHAQLIVDTRGVYRSANDKVIKA
jgi:UDP-N-acetyl-D-glucosamine dehydrogenase